MSVFFPGCSCCGEGWRGRCSRECGAPLSSVISAAVGQHRHSQLEFVCSSSAGLWAAAPKGSLQADNYKSFFLGDALNRSISLFQSPSPPPPLFSPSPSSSLLQIGTTDSLPISSTAGGRKLICISGFPAQAPGQALTTYETLIFAGFRRSRDPQSHLQLSRISGSGISCPKSQGA